MKEISLRVREGFISHHDTETCADPHRNYTMQRILIIFVLALASPFFGLAYGEDILSSTRLYSGMSRPVPVILALRGRNQVPPEGFQLVLLNGEGTVIESADGLQPGMLDLGELLPSIWTLKNVARAQIIADGVAIGTPLVIQPLVNPKFPRSGLSDTGNPRVIGFDDEPLGEDEREQFERLREESTWPTKLPTMNSGIKIYPDRDVLVEVEGMDAIRIVLGPEYAPNTAWNFRDLAEHGFYDDTIFHRIFPININGDRMWIMGGDPSGSGIGTAGKFITMEPSTLPHDLGVLSMTRGADPNSASSRFLICLSRPATAAFDGQYASFGWIAEGRKTLAQLADLEIDQDTGIPIDPPRISRMKLVPAAPHDPGTSRTNSKITTWWEAPKAPEPGRIPR